MNARIDALVNMLALLLVLFIFGLIWSVAHQVAAGPEVAAKVATK